MSMTIIWKVFRQNYAQAAGLGGVLARAARNHRERKPNMSEEEKKNFWQNMKDVLYGMASHDMSRYALRTRASMEHLFILITMGDMIGVPILPPYYSLRLLPYVVPQISTWKRRLLREKDVSDAMF
jgi:hypothetical protein